MALRTYAIHIYIEEWIARRHVSRQEKITAKPQVYDWTFV
jgi:hypothetical protein